MSYAMTGANDHYLLTSFTQSTYNYGGAHPGTGFANLNYSLDLGRELKTTDVFASSTAWQSKLTQLAIAKLKAEKTDIWDGKEGDEGVRSGVTSETQWTPTATGLTVSFGQYQINCYACGAGEVSFTWQELKPLLNPGFHPELLPAPPAK